MNTTKDIHLSHIKFTIDQEAYKNLDSYLKKLSLAFSSNTSKDEILEDIETHIAELFSENTSVNQVVSLSQVNKAIEVLGSPEELAKDEDESGTSSKNNNIKKKFFRDTEDSYIGGVASGLSHYFGLATVWVRLLFIVFSILPTVPLVLIIYLIIWLIVPYAKSNIDKIRMTGETLNVTSIKNKVESVLPEIEKQVTDFDKNYAKGIWRNLKYYVKKTIKFFIKNIGKLFKLVSIIFGYILMFYSFSIGISSIFFVFISSYIKNIISSYSSSAELIIDGSTIFEINEYLQIDILDIVTSITIFWIVLFGFLIVIPCIVLFIIGMKFAFRNRFKIHKMTMYLLSSIWIISIMYLVYKLGKEIIFYNFGNT
ncbi:PspC domain-containing protein [Flavobacteriaceae bacterium]|nr:PspC domain-containing protein [Flavobacteriaceae bacterium]